MRVEGRNPVREALRAGASIKVILIAGGVREEGAVAEILRLAQEQGVKVKRVPRGELDGASTTESHQGVAAEIAFRFVPWQNAVDAAERRGTPPLLVALDGITDPQNAGSIIRSAHMLGADAILIPSRRSVSITATVVKASAGALWHVPVDDVGNLERALADCRERGLWVACLDGDADVEVSNCPLLSEPLVLVVGSEGRGVSHLLRQRADVAVKIAQFGRIDSLSAPVAAAIALYAVTQSRAKSEASSQMSESQHEVDRS